MQDIHRETQNSMVIPTLHSHYEVCMEKERHMNWNLQAFVLE